MTALRATVAAVDLTAIEHNIGVLSAAAGDAEVWAVVKANGYGHGAVEVARAALAAGAGRLCVALVQEAVELRAAGIAAPVLVLSQQPVDQLDDALEVGLELVAHDAWYLRAVDERAAALGIDPVPVHLHVDTGMSRVGAHPADVAELALLIDELPGVVHAATMTHLAVADDLSTRGRAGTAEQLARFAVALGDIRAAGVDPGVVHASNSAATLAHPGARHHAVRTGIAIYGIAPSGDVDPPALRPALQLTSRVSSVKDVDAGTQVSYGWRHRCDTPTRLATVPVGYADGVPRRLGTGSGGQAGFDVLVGGKRCPIVGVVTMDQFVVDVGDLDVHVGDEVVLLGAQGDHRIGPNDWADHLGTIGYEIVCGIAARVPRVYISSPGRHDG